jgi:hypothetical protein
MEAVSKYGGKKSEKRGIPLLFDSTIRAIIYKSYHFTGDKQATLGGDRYDYEDAQGEKLRCGRLCLQH